MNKKVNPTHYGKGKTEAIEIIEQHDLNFCLGNVVKYVLRAGKKEGETVLEDLEKALWYLQRELQKLKTKNQHVESFDDFDPT